MTRYLVLPIALLATAQVAYAQLDFGSAVNLNAGVRPEGLAADDFDGDGDIDLATTIEAPDRIRILLRSGAGYTLAATSLPSSSSPQDLVAGDFDGDGDSDLAVAVRDPQGAVRIYMNNGAASFSFTSSATVGSRPRGMSVGDIDGDGDLDIAVANRDSDSASVLINNGGGAFVVTTLTAGAEPRAAGLGDIDGDGDLDLAVGNHDERTVDVWRRAGSGFTFTATLSSGSQARPEDVALADVDGDGLDDIVVARGDSVLAQNRVTIMKSLGGGSFASPASFATGGLETAALVLADFDDDGDLDVAAANEGGTTVTLLRNSGSGSFGAAQLRTVGTHPDDVAAADLDGDGDIDIAVANRDSNTISILSNTSSGGPGPTIPPTPPSGLVASDGTSSAHVLTSWNAAASSVEHQIWRQVVGGPAAQPLTTRPGNLHWYTDASAQQGITYRYWVRSRVTTQWSTFSAPDTGFKAASTSAPPVAPGTIVATDSTSSAYVLITWSVSPGATSYQVWRATLGGAAAPLGLSSNGAVWYTDTTATPGVTYRYWVRARNVFGWGPFAGPELGSRAGG